MRFFKRDDNDLSAADRARQDLDRLGDRALMKLHRTSHLQAATWVVGMSGNLLMLCLMSNPMASTAFFDVVSIAGWMGAWRANKGAMRMFCKQLSMIEKTPELSEQVRSALAARREKADFKPFEARDKTAMTWVCIAANLGLAPASSFLYQVHTRPGDMTPKIGEWADLLRKKWERTLAKKGTFH
jgi:hypothetical protein